MALNDHEGQMEARADIAHCQATVGEIGAARDLFNQSLDLAKQLESLSGQLVARWGLADLAEIEQDYETAMLVLSDSLRIHRAQRSSTGALRQRIKDLTDLRNEPLPDGKEA